MSIDLQFLSGRAPVARPEPDDDRDADLKAGLKALDEAQPSYAKAAVYYNGSQPEFFASMRLRMTLGALGVTFNFNFAKLPVDAVAERLEIAGISTKDDGSLTIVQTEWEANQLDLYVPDIMLNVCKFGDAYLFVWPSPEPEQEILDISTGVHAGEVEESTVDMFYVSPRLMRVIYDDENEHEKKFAIKRWIDEATNYTFVNLYYPDRIEKYMLAPETINMKQQWERRIDPGDDGWPVDNPYGEIPVFHFRNGFPYGTPEHKDAYGPQDAIHKLVISHMASVDYNAFPQRYAIMDERYDTSEAAFGDEGEYSFSLATGATQQSPTTDPRSQLTADPASVWFMKGVKSYGEFPPADPMAFLRPFSDYVHGMAVVTTTPMHFLDPIVSNVSGESLRVIEAPFAKKVRKRQMSFGATWRDVWRFVLVLHGQERPSPIQVNWVPAATVSDLTTLQGQLIKAQLGVPPRQLLLEQGYTPEQLDEWGVETASVPEQYTPTFGGPGGETP